MPTPLDPRDSRIIQWIRGYRTPNEPEFDVNAAWSRFQVRHGVRVKPRRVFGVSPLVWQIAAVLVMAVGGTLVWRAQRSSAITMLERVVANGERSTLTLDDGSRVTLNGGSRLRYPVGAGRRDRDLYLEGEALFEVTHDPSRAFRVHAGRGVIRDIGTRFTVRAYSATSPIEVVVTDGVVELARDSSGVPGLRLTRGEGGTLSPSGDLARMTTVSAGRYVGWTTGELVFDNTALREAASELERWYGVRIDVDSTLAARPVAARFHGERVDQVLDAITLALGVTYQHIGSTYTIQPRIR